jgi:NAD(P)H-dependent FMN reductase
MSASAEHEPRLQIILCSTRPGRVGEPVARWFEQRARECGAFDVEVVDLGEVSLPFMDEPHHPRLGRYVHEHTKAWSARVDAADAFVFVMPEYNYGFNAPLKNAIDYLNREWMYKPVGFVSYGGVSGGTRAMQMVKQVITAVKMTAVYESVSIPFVRELLDDDQTLSANESMDAAAADMLGELQRLEKALRPLRESLRAPAG